MISALPTCLVDSAGARPSLWKRGATPDKWDGRTDERVALELERVIQVTPRAP